MGLIKVSLQDKDHVLVGILIKILIMHVLAKCIYKINTALAGTSTTRLKVGWMTQMMWVT